MIGPDIVKDTEEKVQVIRQRLKATSGRQKSYVDLKRRDVEYEVGDKVFLKVSPWRKILRFCKKGKLSPRFIGPYFWNELALWLIVWHSLWSWPNCIMCFMCRCFGDIVLMGRTYY